MVTTQADWSLNFDLGMNFEEWHAPVPLAHELGVFDRALKFLLNLRPRPASASAQLDNDGSSAPGHLAGAVPALGQGPRGVDSRERGRSRPSARRVAGTVALAAQHAIVFSIRCYLLGLHELVTMPTWGRHLHRVLKTLHPALVEYKGLSRYRDTVGGLAGAVRRRRAWNVAPFTRRRLGLGI